MWKAALVLVCAAPARAESLPELWAAARGKGQFQAPAPEELRRAEALFATLLGGTPGREVLEGAWAELGWELKACAAGGEEFWALRELPGRRCGRGFFLFRRGPAPALALQAPHGTEDLHTGQIALRLFREGRFAAGAWSTLPRSAGDLAHLPDTYLQAFTRAFAGVHRHGLVVQLHGFEAGKRKSPAGSEAELIASNGTARPPRWLLGLAASLRAEGASLRVYPTEVRELGGTTNAQARLLQDLGHDGFLHLEISLAYRERLREEAPLRAAFLKCLTDIYRKDRRNGGE